MMMVGVLTMKRNTGLSCIAGEWIKISDISAIVKIEENLTEIVLNGNYRHEVLMNIDQVILWYRDES